MFVKRFGGGSVLRHHKSTMHARVPEFSAFVMVGVVAALIIFSVSHNNAVQTVARIGRVLTGISDVFSLVQTAEGGARGYLITREENQLTNYYKAMDQINPALSDLDKLISADSAKQALAELKAAIAIRLARLRTAVDLRRTQNLDDVLATIKTGVGPTTMVDIRAGVSKLRSIENDLLAERSSDEERLTWATLIAAALALVIVIASMSAWIFNARREARNLLTTIAERENNEAQIRQMQKMEAVGQLTGGLAHDLNNMLAIIISGIALAQKRLAAGDTNIERFINAAFQGATRAATMTSQLMAFSRQQPLNPQTTDANKLLSGMSDIMQRSLGETIQAQTVLSAGLWLTNIDVAQLENAILNLAINARDAMPKGGKLTLETANSNMDDVYARRNSMPAGQYVQISVTDTGVGMTEDVIDKVFDPYFTTKGVGKGTGLGLSQVFGFIKQSGGHVKIYSEPEQGTTVKMYLPRLDDASPEQVLRTAKEEAWPDLHRDNWKYVILVVEDDPLVNELTVAALRELTYTVIHADGAIRALEMLDAHPEIGMLFTDIVMPDVNGRQLAAEALRRQPNIKVLYTTGFTRNAIVHSGKLDAGLHFIAKPFTLVQIAAKMTEVLGTPKVA
jgi:signal transduction histidine kinase